MHQPIKVIFLTNGALGIVIVIINKHYQFFLKISFPKKLKKTNFGSTFYFGLSNQRKKIFGPNYLFKREIQQNPQDLESGGSADRLETNFFGFSIQK
jgi:hypothetical protein